MLISSENAVKFEQESCIVFEYEFPYQNLGCCKAIINGRYPKIGYAINTECDQIYFILKGQGTIFYDGKSFNIKEGDCFFMQRGKSIALKVMN